MKKNLIENLEFSLSLRKRVRWDRQYKTSLHSHVFKERQDKGTIQITKE